ncbi:MAG: AAA family ATPase [Candidatus Aenigmarchaeota archaeon]|nr:AAA family ATPase [Candidatus Aenigmarchaeota archaeon]
MMLKSVSLRNIRSYTDEKIDFPEKATLLSGDIGSGKSTILMAVDFALFGLKKGELQGSEMLRHGADDGFVELEFESGGKTISVKRTLKRGKSVTQNSGSITENGKETQMSPTELKAAIMGMLGYSQPGIFRYTVYTPQEEMKSILLKPETRLEILRNVFDAEKYSRIKGNSKSLLSEMRAMKREADAFSKDINEKKKFAEEQRNLMISLDGELLSVESSLGSVNAKHGELKRAIAAMKSDYEKNVRLRGEAEKKELEMKNAKTRVEKAVRDIAEIRKRVEESSAALEGYRQTDIESLEKAASETDAEKGRLISRKAVISRETDNLSAILERKFCNVCGQEVASPEGFRKKIDAMADEMKSIESRMKGFSEQLSMLRETIARAHRMESIIKSHDTDKNWLERLEKEKSEAGGIILSLEMDIEALKPAAAEAETAEKKILLAENELYLVQDEKLKLEKSKARKEQERNDITASVRRVEEEIMLKTEAKKRSLRLSERGQWLESYFLPLVDTIEKNVMANIQLEFDRFFQQWFGVIMGDQLSVRVDDKFTPIIEQNGYETDYGNLSGGEKTSVALAYRLALNKTINTLSDEIKTKEIIILDEPTDGFSTEQLDRIRDVINQLSLRQIIIVSHEPKIDTFVDSVIRVYKENHVSRISYS